MSKTMPAWQPGLVNHLGQEWRPSMESLKPRPKTRADAPQAYFKGYIVTGYRPGEIAEALRQRQADIAKWKLQPIGRCPSDLTAEGYINTTKPKRVRSKPYEVESAAALCAEIARREGWEHVTVTAVSKGQPTTAALF